MYLFKVQIRAQDESEERWPGEGYGNTLGVSALQFAVALDPDHSIAHNTTNAGNYGWPQTADGWERPAMVPSDTTAKDAIDVDGELPDWLAEGIVRALIATYHDGRPRTAELGGSAFQAGATTVLSQLGDLLSQSGINISEPLDQLVAQVAPALHFEGLPRRPAALGSPSQPPVHDHVRQIRLLEQLRPRQAAQAAHHHHAARVGLHQSGQRPGPLSACRALTR